MGECGYFGSYLVVNILIRSLKLGTTGQPVGLRETSSINSQNERKEDLSGAIKNGKNELPLFVKNF